MMSELPENRINDNLEVKGRRPSGLMEFFLTNGILSYSFRTRKGDLKGNSPVEWIELLPVRRKMPVIALIWIPVLFCSLFAILSLGILWLENCITWLLPLILIAVILAFFALSRILLCLRYSSFTRRLKLKPEARPVEFYLKKSSEDSEDDINRFLQNLENAKSTIEKPIQYTRFPENLENLLGISSDIQAHYQQGEIHACEKSVIALIAKRPHYRQAWMLRVLLATDAGRFNEALGYCSDMETLKIADALTTNKMRMFIWMSKEIKERSESGIDELEPEQDIRTLPDDLDNEPEATVSLVGEQKGSFLELRKSVFVCTFKNINGSFELYAPVEKVRILPPGRRAKAHWLHFIFIPAFVISMCFVFLIIGDLIQGVEESVIALVLSIFATVVFLGVAIGVFLIGKQTTKMQLGDEGPIIEFWERPGRNRKIDYLFARINHLKSLTKDLPEFEPVGWAMESKWLPYRRFALIISGSLAIAQYIYFQARSIRIIALLILIAGVVVALRSARFRWHPKFRLAAKLERKGDYAGAAEVLSRFLKENPSNKMVWLMLFEIYVSGSMHDDAMDCCDAMASLGIVDAGTATEMREYISNWRILEKRMGQTRTGMALKDAEVSSAT